MARTTTTTAADTRRAGQLLLASSAIGALNTINGRRPLARKGPAGILAFSAGFPTSEWPLHAVGWQALATLGFVRKGALRTAAGWAGLGLAAVSWAGLYRIWTDAHEATGVFDEALGDVFGDELGPVDAELASRPTLPRRVQRQRAVMAPLPRHRRLHVTSERSNLAYGEAGKRNTLDIWRPKDLPADAKAPVIIEVHGGAWVIGNKEQQAMPLLSHLVDNGWICVSINYRLSPRATWPDQIVDVKQAIAWVKAHIAEYGGDPEFVAITGGSAGGHLSSLAALTANEPEFQPGFEEADTSVVAAVPFYGVYDWTNRDGTGRADMEEFLGKYVLKASRVDQPELWEKASTMSWVRPDAPPFFIIHGTNDTLVPVEQARAFATLLQAESKNPVVYAELDGAQHAFELGDSPRTFATVRAVHRFLETIRAREGHTGVGAAL